MTIEIDPSAGFCFGVKRAISMAEEELEKGNIQSLGEIVHNEEEQKRLQEKGLETISTSCLDEQAGGKVLIRAHGEPPETFQRASELKIALVDATCPIVKGIQKKIRKAFEVLDPQGGLIVIFGKPGHPETIGLVGQTGGKACVVSSPDDYSRIPRQQKIELFAQTTMNPADYAHLADSLRQALIADGKDPSLFLKVNDTICRHVSGREQHVRAFARKHDLILFVSGTNSSNGRFLLSCCKEENSSSYRISGPGEIDPAWLQGKKSIGISGATSTPEWLMIAVKDKLSSLNLTFT